MAKKYWWPGTMGQQMMLLNNFSAKVGYYRVELNLSEAEIDEIVELCRSMIEVCQFVSNAKAYHKQLTAWRDNFFLGEDDGQPLTVPSPMAPPPSLHLYAGAVKRFSKIRASILAAKGYSPSIGFDLGLYGAERTPIREDEILPEISISTDSGSKVRLKGTMQRMDAMIIEYAPDNGQFKQVAVITRTPAAFDIPPATPGTPEKGIIRAIFYKNNQTIGNFSSEHPITIY